MCVVFTSEDKPSEDVDTWVQKGWVDLHPSNMALWQERFRKMENSRQLIRGRGSSAVTIEGYLYETIEIGEVVGWIFNNEHDGYRSLTCLATLQAVAALS